MTYKVHRAESTLERERKAGEAAEAEAERVAESHAKGVERLAEMRRIDEEQEAIEGDQRRRHEEASRQRERIEQLAQRRADEIEQRDRVEARARQILEERDPGSGAA